MYLDRYEVIELPRSGKLHWILNPGLAFNELILGQRIPARDLVDQLSDAPWFDRVYVECKSCGAIHRSLLWRKALMGNWFGLVCPSCEAKIPTLLNVFSLALLIPTAPLWFPLKLFFEKRLHRRQLALIRNTLALPPKVQGMSLRAALAIGGVWGAAMFLFFVLVMPSLTQTDMTSQTPTAYFLAALMCAVGGVLFGLYLRWASNRRVKQIAGKGSWPSA